jgi:hypothetical protein
MKFSRTRGFMLLSAASLAALAVPLAARCHRGREIDRRVQRLQAERGQVAFCPAALTLTAPSPGTAAPLASWQSIGGCGAGASTGAGGGVKWIGRSVSGGLFHVECQANYVKMPYGYNYVGTTLVGYDLTPEWRLGVSVPYLYKYMVDPYDVDVDLANKGPGDVNLMLTHRFGATNAWSATVSGGIPTGTYQVQFRNLPLPQDRQLGLGKPTAALVLDHTIDNLWGPTVLGASLNWRGGENDVHSYRAPSGTVYSYVGYLLGPFVPAIGMSATGYAGLDRDLGEQQALPLVSVAANASLEWSGEYVAVLLGASLPYDYGVRSEAVRRYSRLGAWVLALGFAFSPF